MTVTEIGRISAGRTYVKHQQRVVKRDGCQVVEDVDLGEAVVREFVLDDRTGHELVAYEMTAAPGRVRVCSLVAFALGFRPVKPLVVAEKAAQPPGEVAAAPPEKIAGYKSGGNPW